MSANHNGVAREIKQSKPFGSLGEEAVVGLMRTVDVLRRQFCSLLEPAGITVQQYNVLRILRGAGERGLPTLEIGERMIEHAPGITRMIDRLAAKGLVARERCTEDRRVVYCAITDAGRRLLARLDEPVRQADREAVGALSDDELGTLIGMLDAIRAGQRDSSAGSGASEVQMEP